MERKNLIVYALLILSQCKDLRFDIGRLRGSDDGTCERILDELKTV